MAEFFYAFANDLFDHPIIAFFSIFVTLCGVMFGIILPLFCDDGD